MEAQVASMIEFMQLVDSWVWQWEITIISGNPDLENDVLKMS